jgi:hypothetical protein
MKLAFLICFGIDEMNSIQLQAQILGCRLITFFEVGNNLLTISYFMQNNQLYFEANFAHNKTKLDTGGTIVDVPLVLNYRISIFHQAVLK